MLIIRRLNCIDAPSGITPLSKLLRVMIPDAAIVKAFRETARHNKIVLPTTQHDRQR